MILRRPSTRGTSHAHGKKSKGLTISRTHFDSHVMKLNFDSCETSWPVELESIVANNISVCTSAAPATSFPGRLLFTSRNENEGADGRIAAQKSTFGEPLESSKLHLYARGNVNLGRTSEIAIPTVASRERDAVSDHADTTPRTPSRSDAANSIEDVESISPQSSEHFRKLGRNSPGTAPRDPKNFPPVSFIPATSPLGPRNLAPAHYNCPVPGCSDRFGQLGRAKGYFWVTLGPHIFVAHGEGPAVDAARLMVRRRVMALRCSLAQPMGTAPEPCDWTDRSQLHRASWELACDLEELKLWERSWRVDCPRLRAKIPTSGASGDRRSDGIPHEQRGPEQSETSAHDKKGKGTMSASGQIILNSATKISVFDERHMHGEGPVVTGGQVAATDHPSTPDRAHRAFRPISNHFRSPLDTVLVGKKKMQRSSPKKTLAVAGQARRAEILLQNVKGIPGFDDLEKENLELVEGPDSMEID